MNVAVLGYGTVGSGVVEILKDKKDINLMKVYNRKNKIKEAALGNLYTENLDDVLKNQDIDVIIETMGGIAACEIIKNALLNKKHVITANKEVVALYLEELLLLAKKNNVMFLFEASVAGTIPVIRNVCDLVKSDKIKYMCGILNGTTNYILTRMKMGISFSDALKEAQGYGYAELDPEADLLGLDMVRKIAILTMLATNSKVEIKDIYHYGIKGINQKFLAGIPKDKTIKFIAESIIIDDQINLVIEPVAFDQEHLLANLNYNYNGIIIETLNHGQLFFSGFGAGKMPTASAVVDDLCKIITGCNYVYYLNENNYHTRRIKDISDYYVFDGNQVVLKKNISRDEAKIYQFYARVM